MKFKVLCIGEILWDSLPQGLFLGGAPFNVAYHLNTLGCETVLVSKIGKDILGEKIIKSMNALGMSTKYLQVDNNYPTGKVNVKLDLSGYPSYKIAEPAAWDFIEINDSLIDVSRRVDAFIFGTLCQRNLVSQKTIETLRKLNSCNIFDINLRTPYLDIEVVESSLIDSQIVKFNDDEFRQLSNWFHLSNDLKEGVEQIADKFHCTTICITHGSNGSSLWHNGKWLNHNGFRVKIRDTVGAGDAFLAALLFKLLYSDNNYDALDFANAVGAYVVMQNGATPILDLEKIEKLRLSGRNRAIDE
jgi:fructokinase